MGRNFSELPDILAIKDNVSLKFFKHSGINEIEPEPDVRKVALQLTTNKTVLPNHWGHVQVYNDEYEGDLCINASVRSSGGKEYCIPHTVITLTKGRSSVVPCINLSDEEISFKKNRVFVRAYPCVEETQPIEKISMIQEKNSRCLPEDQIILGHIDKETKQIVIKLLNEYRDCFALNTSDLGCAKSASLTINLNDNKPFSYRPYRMSRTEQNIVKDIVEELLLHGIIRESDSEYSSPVLLVKKKNGEQRLCIDYRKLNSLTIKDSHPLPRIDDQIDKLQGGNFFISLDLRSGYHQVPIEEPSKHFTAFVTPEGQYEYNRIPFGLSNAPRVFQRLMTKILRPVRENSALYLDDILLYAPTIPETLEVLQKVLKIFREEGLTLNLKKCSFLKSSVTYLGYDIEKGKVRPGTDKIKAVENFPTPNSVHQVRQFLGLTSYFRHFVRNYASIAYPLTRLIKKNTSWKWEENQENAFQKLKSILSTRPVLSLFNHDLPTEVHTDASQLGLAGILLQKQTDGRLHPVAYYSRQTNGAEQKYHSYELETLAIVESLRKFRTYLLGISFVVVTDCNSIKAASKKKQLIPRIARWWLELQEFTFEVQYRPGKRMNHVDALSRNTTTNGESTSDVVLRIEEADWVLSGQLTDDKIREIHEILSKPPTSEHEKHIYKNYCLRENRIYRITAKGILWLVPKGMRQRVVKTAHDDLGHFGVEKTLHKLCETYWFPRMRAYVENYISCCIPCLYHKRNSGKKEGFLHSIPKGTEPLNTFHVDHLGPFPKSKRKNAYLIVGIDAFTKFVFLRAAKSTKTKYVIDYFKDIFATYGIPKTLISDRGSSFTSKAFNNFCNQNNMRHIMNAVATPRANGQVERLNHTVLAALLPSVLEEELWDEQVRKVQFAINNVVNKSTGKTPSQLMFGFTPRNGSDAPLRDEVQQIPTLLENIIAAREDASDKIQLAQTKQKKYFDKKRKKPRIYKEGELVAIIKQTPSTGTSKKLAPLYSGPMVIKKILPNDRYVVQDMSGSHRTLRSSKYENTVAVDQMRPWCNPGGISDETDSDSGEDGVPLSSDPSDDEQME